MHGVWNQTAERYVDGIYDGTTVKLCPLKRLITLYNLTGMGFRSRHHRPVRDASEQFAESRSIGGQPIEYVHLGDPKLL